MNKQDFIKMIKKEARNQAWHSGTYTVNKSQIGIKLFGKWIQRIEIQTPTATFKDSIPEQKTLKALVAELENTLKGI